MPQNRNDDLLLLDDLLGIVDPDRRSHAHDRTVVRGAGREVRDRRDARDRSTRTCSRSPEGALLPDTVGPECRRRRASEGRADRRRLRGGDNDHKHIGMIRVHRPGAKREAAPSPCSRRSAKVDSVWPRHRRLDGSIAGRQRRGEPSAVSGSLTQPRWQAEHRRRPSRKRSPATSCDVSTRSALEW